MPNDAWSAYVAEQQVKAQAALDKVVLAPVNADARAIFSTYVAHGAHAAQQAFDQLAKAKKLKDFEAAILRDKIKELLAEHKVVS